jgi:GNAT superfamily N-acetyltransferase
MNIRPVIDDDYPALVEIHRSLNIVWPPWSDDPRAWLEGDRRRDPKCKAQRWVADVAGEIVGAASFATHVDDYHPQKFYINIEVLEAYRGRGIGAALYEQIMHGLSPYDPQVLRTDILDNQIQSYPFVEKRGFREVWRETPVHLEVANFDLSPYQDLENELKADAIQIYTLRELVGDGARDRKLYDLYMSLSKDVPSEYSEFTPSPYEDWESWCLNDPSTDWDAFFVAVHGNEYIALHELGTLSSGPDLLGGLLGTLPDYRGKGIGLALMLRAIVFARQNGIAVFRTCTARCNTRMQILFDKLGFSRDPEWLQCQKDIR